MWNQLTISSIGVQCFEQLYPLDEAFCVGTIFQQLNKPFTGVCGDE